MSTFIYGIVQGFRNIVQNKFFSLAAIGTITACLFLLGVFHSLFYNFKHMVYHAESTIGITVFFEPSVTQAQIEHIKSTILACEGVEKVEYVSGEEAWDQFKQDELKGDQDLINSFGNDNPLEDSSSFEVYLDDISQQKNIVSTIEKLEGVRKINSSETLARGLSSFNMLVGYVTGTIIALLIFVSVFLISSAVAMGITARKDEIGIMKLIGATDVFVRLPFLMEGVTMGMIGAFVPLILLRLLYGNVIGFVTQHFSSISELLDFIPVHREFRILIPLLMGVGIGIGLLGSYLSVHKHLKV